MLLIAAVVPICGSASSAARSSTVLLNCAFWPAVTCVGRAR